MRYHVSVKSLIKNATNAILVVIAFTAAFFVTEKLIGNKVSSPIVGDSTDHDSSDLDIGVVHADVPAG